MKHLRGTRPGWRAAGVGAALTGTLGVLLSQELRFKNPEQPSTRDWEHLKVVPRGGVDLGISFRPMQAQSLGLEGPATLEALLSYPFQLIRLAAYWNHIDLPGGLFDFSELDWQVDAAERAGKRIILAVGAVKNLGYPEFFAPDHWLEQPLPEGHLVEPMVNERLLAGARQFITRIVTRYQRRTSIVAWQLEHESVDPLGVEHTWRLSTAFVEGELTALRHADDSRPVMMNGFLPTSTPVRVSQWWRTRDQGDSLAVAARLADIVGIDYYPCHALMRMGGKTLYLDGSATPWRHRRPRRLMESAHRQGRSVMISEGQAEPWETATTPPNPRAMTMYSCTPERLIDNYNQCLTWGRCGAAPLDAYLFWGAEYWLLRQQGGDTRYIRAFRRILES